MPYITPNTVTGSDVLTAALWNTQIRDNMEELRNPVSCEVGLSSTINPYTSNSAISWQVKNWDTSSTPMWTLATNPTRITIRETGLYLVVFKVYTTHSPTPQGVSLNLSVNGVLTDRDSTTPISASGPSFAESTFSTHLPLSVNDYVTAAVAYNYSVTPITPIYTLVANSPRGYNQTRLSVTRISATT